MNKTSAEKKVTTKITTTKSSVKKPNPVDVHVGSRVRLQRIILGMSQEKLGNLLGVTFQQVQKYEKGTNRIGASRLFRLSEVLDVDVVFFYDGLPGSKTSENSSFIEPKTETTIAEFMNSREGIELNQAFIRVNDPKIKRNILNLVRNLSKID